MECYDPAWSPNEGDSALRYAFQNQPDVSAWNCERLAEAFSSIIGGEDALKPLDGPCFALITALGVVHLSTTPWHALHMHEVEGRPVHYMIM